MNYSKTTKPELIREHKALTQQVANLRAKLADATSKLNAPTNSTEQPLPYRQRLANARRAAMAGHKTIVV